MRYTRIGGREGVEKDTATFTLERYLWYHHRYLHKEEFDRGYGAIYSCGGGAQDNHNDMCILSLLRKTTS
jgi:hypothetical protein